MAVDAGEIFRAHPRDHRLSAMQTKEAFAIARQTPSSDESKAIDRSQVPSVIVSASGMATGGRVIHHLRVFAPDPRSTILFTGFQAGGTRGAAMVAGAKAIKIFGEYVEVRADVKNLDMLSAHADADEIMVWLSQFHRAPAMTYVTHGEPDAADSLRKRIEEELKWKCIVPAYRDEAELEVS
jgi:metallo-beta-lactamase family protein